MKVKTAIASIVIALFVFVPVVPLIEWAFAKSWIYPNLIPASWTLEYIETYLFGSSGIVDALVNSIKLSLIVTLFSLILGYLPAKYIGTRKFYGKRAIQILVMLPALAPGITVVFGMMPIFIKLEIYRSYLALVLGQLTFCAPYMIMTLAASFRNYDCDYEFQSESLGVSKFGTFLSVTLPAMKNSIATACTLTFMVSWSMYLFTSVYLPRGFDTLATLLLPTVMNSGSSLQYSALMTIIFFLPSILFLVFSTLVMGSDKKNKVNK